MAVYLVAYDLVKEKSGHDYQPLWDELKRLGAHRTQYSLWLISLDNSAKEVVEHFKQYVDGDDRIWVTRLAQNRYYYVNAIAGTNDWLRANPPD